MAPRYSGSAAQSSPQITQLEGSRPWNPFHSIAEPPFQVLPTWVIVGPYLASPASGQTGLRSSSSLWVKWARLTCSLQPLWTAETPRFPEPNKDLLLIESALKCVTSCSSTSLLTLLHLLFLCLFFSNSIQVWEQGTLRPVWDCYL